MSIGNDYEVADGLFGPDRWGGSQATLLPKGADRLFGPTVGAPSSARLDEVAGPARNAVVISHPAISTTALIGAKEEASHGAYCIGFGRKGIPDLHS